MLSSVPEKYQMIVLRNASSFLAFSRARIKIWEIFLSGREYLQGFEEKLLTSRRQRLSDVISIAKLGSFHPFAQVVLASDGAFTSSSFYSSNQDYITKTGFARIPDGSYGMLHCVLFETNNKISPVRHRLWPERVNFFGNFHATFSLSNKTKELIHPKKLESRYHLPFDAFSKISPFTPRKFKSATIN